MSDEKKRNEHEELMSKKASMFFKNQDKIHIQLKNGGWERGWIRESPTFDFIILTFTDEGRLKNGVDSKPFFFLEIEDINKFLEGGR